MMAPPTVSKELKPSMLDNSVLLAISKPPAMEVKLANSKSSKSSLETMAKEPPTVVKVGISIWDKEVLMKPKEALTACNLAKEAEEMSLKVMLLAHCN
ncbi:hypothetical protein WICPIJ_006637 [Wickerhamomyces pijperi]|uniref:Uncharacterized protein n=1 Tax=Wickerhamomyces pijperi TaxID=599730 RepID=A0A9P8TKT0_WICPI|nr:hypothetical protein WICPIJ_006637 [Wickerhamomyces pijperi]